MADEVGKVQGCLKKLYAVTSAKRFDRSCGDNRQWHLVVVLSVTELHPHCR